MQKNKFQSYNVSVQEVADYILCKTDIEAEDYISNLKLQKLLYYCQGFVLALTGKTLFDNDILAWEHGPVVKEMYDVYKAYGAQEIMPKDRYPENYFDDLKTDDIADIIDEVWNVYGQFSAWKLRNMTHDELPWKKTPRNDVISNSLMYNYFKTQVQDV